MKLTLPIILVLGLLSGLTPLAIDAYLPSIPTISKSLNTDIGLIQLTLSIYLLVFAFMQILFGPISDAIGRRKVVVGGLAVFAIGSFLCALAQSYEMLLTGRAIQAFGGAAVAVSVPALVKDGLSINQFAKAMSMIMLVMALAPLAAPIIGGAILTVLSWHYIFVLLGILAILAVVLFLRTIPETLPIEKRTPFSFGNAIRNYIILLKNRSVMGYIVASAFYFAGMMSFITGCSFVYIEIYGVDPAHFGFLVGLNVIAMMLASTINGRYVEKLGTEVLSKYAIYIPLVASTLMIALSFFNHPPLWLIIVSSMLFMGPMGILGSGFMAGALKHAGNHNGSVTALAGTSRFALGALGGVVVSILHNGTFIPMLATIATCGIIAFVCFKLTVKYSATAITD
ncbi:Bcr/CflA family multidrug efflux MFS transporter [Marinomonas sp. M1K-6]|uniref:Bcr/CflA family efflux transporter n=1 Tax=Marinomonas profundi TaxID=2726122 RepID=A0A847RA84_9GAMM|nr:Bcr/CflA family multidrug efflux MFS transporter [Marinomonas profundi]NLQ17864.1 Bcr/CflA family multidrug efflux MFS transporter [Marinomonas profundi]UDV03479.1 Bcr/CflA family multidrug efflux MFS transporter [Marinomonas profundi]